MTTKTQKTKLITLAPANVNEVENSHNIFKLNLELNNENELDIDYHKTINAICNLLRDAGWSAETKWSETSKTAITLKKL